MPDVGPVEKVYRNPFSRNGGGFSLQTIAILLGIVVWGVAKIVPLVIPAKADPIQRTLEVLIDEHQDVHDIHFMQTRILERLAENQALLIAELADHRRESE